MILSSVRLNLHQKNRPFKIEVFGLQDNFIGVLQSYEDKFLGQVLEPKVKISRDGTQEFTCRIPKYIMNPETNSREINPRWKDVHNNIIAENTRVIKVTVQFSDKETKIYPFIIDKIVNKRDGHHATYKEITGNGLAFAELGKIGYKLELNSHTLEEDFKNDPDTVANITYWLDKVFPNERDEDGEILHWKTPWSYEIRMDWRGYFDELSNNIVNGLKAGQKINKFYNSKTAYETKKRRDKNWLWVDAGGAGPMYSPRDEETIYEKPYVSNWDVNNNKLQPIAIESFIEKARYIDCSGSNKYNITQDIAQTFEVFCVYEYECDSNGYFKKEYVDEYGKVWTGKRVVFFNKAIKTDNPFTINYQHNLDTIQRTIDSSEVYTKLYVVPVSSETMDTGYVSIADTTLNPLLDDFILNFDYMYEVGSINALQKAEVEGYKVSIHKLNKKLIQLEEEYNDLTIELNDLLAKKASAEASLASAQEQVELYETYRDNEVTNTPVIKDKNNSYSNVLTPHSSFNILYGQIRLQGVNAATIKGYNTSYKTQIFDSDNLIVTQSLVNIDSSDNKWYLINDEYGFPTTIFTSKNNSILSEANITDNPQTGAIVYLSLEYCPKNKYIAICEKLYNTIQKEKSQIAKFEELIGSDIEGEETGLRKTIREKEEEREQVLLEKEELNHRLERILGPALREGYWAPNTYDDPGQGYNIELSRAEPKYGEENAYFIFDDVLFEGEQEEFYYINTEESSELKKEFYPFIDLSKIYTQIGSDGNKTSDFCISLFHPVYKWEMNYSEQMLAGKKYYFQLDGKYYGITEDNGETSNWKYDCVEGDIISIHTSLDDNKLPKVCYKKVDSEEEIYVNVELLEWTDVLNNQLFNITTSFMGTGQFLSSRNLYNNSGFTLSFLKNTSGQIIPVALLQSEDIDYEQYQTVRWSFDKNNIINSTTADGSSLRIEKNQGDWKIVYPRCFLDYRNVNYDSDSLIVRVTADGIKLTKFEDYTILLRKGKTYITLKITDVNLLKYILDEKYPLVYQVSRANEQLYLDAEEVAKENSKPRYSYEVQLANLPQEHEFIELGQLVHISDFNVDAQKEYGYVSEIEYALEEISKDSVVIANYKTKFEDLFSAISAQSEAMTQNQASYNIAAAAFVSNGEVKPTVFQKTLDDNSFAFNFSSSNVSLDDTGGLVITNQTPYSTGNYGQVALRGGGLFCSNEVDDKGERIWTTAITPEGINATAISAGSLDTQLIRIYGKSNLAFQWNSEGLFAYKQVDASKFDENYFVRLNENGLLYMNDGQKALELGWDGLTISGAEGHLLLNSKNGLQLLDENKIHALVTFGKLDGNYGMFFKNANGDITLKTTNKGNLELVDELKIGTGDTSNFAGLSGHDKYTDSITKKHIRFWAGSNSPNSAPLTIGEDGVLKVKEIWMHNGTSYKKIDYSKLEQLLKLLE